MSDLLKALREARADYDRIPDIFPSDLLAALDDFLASTPPPAAPLVLAPEEREALEHAYMCVMQRADGPLTATARGKYERTIAAFQRLLAASPSHPVAPATPPAGEPMLLMVPPRAGAVVRAAMKWREWARKLERTAPEDEDCELIAAVDAFLAGRDPEERP